MRITAKDPKPAISFSGRPNYQTIRHSEVLMIYRMLHELVKKTGGSRPQKRGFPTAETGVPDRRKIFKPSNGAGLRPLIFPNTLKTFNTFKSSSSGPLLSEGRLL